MFTAIRIYKTKVERLDEPTLHKIETEFTQILRTVPGFHAYRLIDSGNYSAASISFYETEEGALESIEKTREWVKANLSHLVEGPPTIFTGQQVFSELA
ncbi:hypothetical protein [Candidatus Lucifugimonas marina]|uniref:ABM domain-containing protein n=1 Tax=Candidatus Lucifugimonas marina TaxID=3038979 RepID=A0AAJ6CRM9_9CHLR|nr:hypothetical protein [SAR202 cluster bacterium JH702]MDG0869921.1 hypothetical protein [SAR202 cluster bacterium JH639]WFG34645.1 hypothetical protein GKN94_02770 [SAR202 cluster bacterium JH545]WFG38573.1 hypothetical protein GKO48_02780 [SAR202 cluster bacterium JH1073]